MLCTVPKGDRVIEQVPQQFDHPAVRTMADEHQTQDELPQPGPCDRQVEDDVVEDRRGIERLAESLLSGVDLLIEELSADLLLPGQLGDRFCTGKDLDGQVSPLWRQELLSEASHMDRVALPGWS